MMKMKAIRMRWRKSLGSKILVGNLVLRISQYEIANQSSTALPKKAAKGKAEKYRIPRAKQKTGFARVWDREVFFMGFRGIFFFRIFVRLVVGCASSGAFSSSIV